MARVELVSDANKMLSQSDYHQSFGAEPAPDNTSMLRSAGYFNHTDEELEFLATLIKQRTYWQIASRKGAMGY